METHEIATLRAVIIQKALERRILNAFDALHPHDNAARGAIRLDILLLVIRHINTLAADGTDHAIAAGEEIV
jgi:hypothetical protein